MTLILRILFALSFLFSAYTKFIGLGYFEITLMDQGLAQTRSLAAQLSRFFVGLEFALGILLLLPFYTRKLLLFSIGLLTAFSLHLGYLTLMGNSENCGCFGEMISMTPVESLFKNALLLFLAFWIYRKNPKEEKEQSMIFVFSILIVASMWILRPLPTAEAQKFNSFTHFEKAGRVDLSKGEALVAVFNLDCEHCQAAATTLGELSRTQQLPPIYALFFQEGSTTVEQFEALTNSYFPYTFIDMNTFFDLIGASPPRLYYLDQGSVVHFWDEAIQEGLKDRFPVQ